MLFCNSTTSCEAKEIQALISKQTEHIRRPHIFQKHLGKPWPAEFKQSMS